MIIVESAVVSAALKKNVKNSKTNVNVYSFFKFEKRTYLNIMRFE